MSEAIDKAFDAYCAERKRLLVEAGERTAAANMQRSPADFRAGWEAAISTPPASQESAGEAVRLTEDELADCWIRALKDEPNHATRLQIKYARNIEAMLAARYATLTAELAEARNMLADAADEVEQWGAYADEYFQQKHDLAGTVYRLRSLASGGTMVTDADRLRAELAEAREQRDRALQQVADMSQEKCDMQEQRDSLRDECERLRGLLSGLVGDIDDLVGESRGVYGLHLNGDGAPWDELLPGGQFERLTHLDDAREAALSASGREGVEGGR